MVSTKLEDLPALALAADTLLYGEKSPYTSLADAGKILQSQIDSRNAALYLLLAGGTMAGTLDMGNLDITNVRQLTFDLTPSTSPGVGQLQWNPTEGTLEVGLLGGNVVLQMGQESHVYSINKSGTDIFDGDVVILTGSQSGLPSMHLSDADDPLYASATGLATEDIPNNASGYITTFGIVRGIKTDSWPEGSRMWLTTTPGVMGLTPPDAPTRKVFIGIVILSHPNDGTIFVTPINIPPLSALSDVYAPSPSNNDLLRWVTVNSRFETYSPLPQLKSQTVTTQGLGVNPDIFAFGFYEFSTTDVTLTQANLTQAFGTANVSYAAHAFCVAGGAGAVNIGVVGLRATGISINDQGVRTLGDSETLSSDITSLSLNEYLESAKKWLGTVTFELFTVSGAPTAYSIDLNYGIAKYDDWSNKDFTITDIEVIGFAGANDADFDVKLIHHELGDWVYAAAGFTPISAGHVIASLVDDHAADDQLVNSGHFAWKRNNLSQAVNGSGSEGFLALISSSANNAVEYCNIHVGVSV